MHSDAYIDGSAPAYGDAGFCEWRAEQLRQIVAKTVCAERVVSVRRAKPIDADAFVITTGDGRVIVMGSAALHDRERFAQLLWEVDRKPRWIEPRELATLHAVLIDLADGSLETAGAR